MTIISDIEKDEHIGIHTKYIVKELRVMIYSQFLEAYKSVTLECMSEEFGVSQTFLDKELSEFISSKRLNCKIDKVTGLIVSKRIDERNALYQNALRKGENILNRIQKLSRMVDN